MRGSAWVKALVWIVNRNGTRRKNSESVEYGHSEVGEMNTNSQREDGYRRALNQLIKHYRNTHHIDSDTEVNYSHINSGITFTGEMRGKKVKKVYKNRISPARKRAIHRTALLSRDGSQESRAEYNRMFREEDKKEYFDQSAGLREYIKELQQLERESRKK